MKKRIFLCCLAAIIFFGCNENGKKKVLEYNQAIGK